MLESTTETLSRPMNGILFTAAGEELARVVESIAVPEYTKAMFQDLEKTGLGSSPHFGASIRDGGSPKKQLYWHGELSY